MQHARDFTRINRGERSILAINFSGRFHSEDSFRIKKCKHFVLLFALSNQFDKLSLSTEVLLLRLNSLLNLLYPTCILLWEIKFKLSNEVFAKTDVLQTTSPVFKVFDIQRIPSILFSHSNYPLNLN